MADNFHVRRHLAFRRGIISLSSGRNTLRLLTLGGLWIDGLDAGASDGPRPRRLALLAILAASGPQGASRERVLGVLWPDSEPEKGRHALSQTLYSLRRDLGVDVVVATHDLRIDVEKLSTDIDEFRSALATNDLKLAASLYRGPFVDGFYLADAPEFERWVDAERSALARDGIRAIEASARGASSEGRWDECAAEWRRLTRLDPLNSRFAASYMEALVAIGDRPGAVAHGGAHAELLKRELDADPDPSFQRLVVRLRDPHGAAAALDVATAQPVPAAPAPTVAAAPADVPNEAPTRSLMRRFAPHAAVLAAVAGFAFAAWRVLPQLTTPPEPVLAVGQIRDLVAPDSAQLGGVLSEMLATSLGRLTDLQVIANSRILELTPRNADTVRMARTDAARRAGATEILEGELIPLPDRQLRLAIRRVDIARGLVRRGYQLTSSDRLALFDSVTILIAADLRVAAPTGSLAEVSTRSPIAYRLYEDGLRAFFQFDTRAAHRLFRAAIREDSTFAMAMYYAWRSAVAINESEQDSLGERTMKLAPRASERDRLLISTHVGAVWSDVPTVLAAAESLIARFPNDPEALVRVAGVTVELGRSTALLEKAIAIDSAAGPMSQCRLCEAFGMLASRLMWADSLARVQTTLDRWMSLRPADHTPWLIRADLLVALGRRAEAEAAFRRAVALGAESGDPNERELIWSLRVDDFDTANRLCRESGSDRTTFSKFRWFCSIALRMQGRFREALALVHEGRVPGTAIMHRGLTIDKVQAAILEMEMGRPLSAANQYETLGRAYSNAEGLPHSSKVRNTAWNLTLAATAATEGNDTLRARSLIDSIEALGGRSLYGRDPKLHLFVRGLLKARAHEYEAAVVDLRSAVFSPSLGYTRISYELGRCLLALNRPAEAIVVLRGPLHGGLDGSGLYLTRTEVHELLAQAFAAAGQGDSASAHYAIVERAWRRADPILAARYAAAKSRLKL